MDFSPSSKLHIEAKKYNLASNNEIDYVGKLD